MQYQAAVPAARVQILRHLRKGKAKFLQNLFNRIGFNFRREEARLDGLFNPAGSRNRPEVRY
jgi:hypothetical protein